MKRLMLPGVFLALAVGCSQNPAGDRGAGQAPPGSADTALLDEALLAEKPARAISVREALTRKEGEKVVVTGRVPGEKLKPYNTAVAAFVLMAPEDLEREDIKSEFDCDDAAT